jgi:hypothetical protein
MISRLDGSAVEANTSEDTAGLDMDTAKYIIARNQQVIGVLLGVVEMLQAAPQADRRDGRTVRVRLTKRATRQDTRQAAPRTSMAANAYRKMLNDRINIRRSMERKYGENGEV